MDEKQLQELAREICGQQAAANPDRYADCDQEAWVLRRLETLVRLTQAVVGCKDVCADETAVIESLDGAIHGTAREIIALLGMMPCHTNIRKPRPHDLLMPRRDGGQPSFLGAPRMTGP